jgi:hypothetical protein
MRHLGKTLNFEFEFRASRGVNWPSFSVLVNNLQISTHTITDRDRTVSVDLYFDSGVNNINLLYYSKHQYETVIDNGVIVADQTLELINMRVDDIQLEPWFWTDHYYAPQYFQGYKKQFPDAPERLPSQLIWHFPGRYRMMNLPDSDKFWAWYQQQRTQRVLSTLIDPTGQIRANHESFDDADQQLIKEIKKLIDV